MDPEGKKKSKIYVGMSGGVDSSVAAALLKKDSFDIRGIFMKCWSPESAGIEFSGECQWEKDQRDAKEAAEYLGLPFESWNFETEYKAKVVDYMIGEYRRGRTPNPDIMCNREIKFGLFLNRALEEGADFIATGHYARKQEKNGSCQLLAGADKNKDQSYFLYTFNQDQLAKTLFPIGDYTKDEVRAMAREFGLPNWDRPDSQGICFVGELDLRGFLKTYIKEDPGKIVTSSGKEIGPHIGLPFYTIGQRQGIGIGGGIPYYVAEKQEKTNTLVVAEGENDPVLYSHELVLENTHWISGKEPRLPIRCEARIRYRQPLEKCKVSRDGETLQVHFSEEQRAITPGQSVVFYKNEEVLGGGVIAE